MNLKVLSLSGLGVLGVGAAGAVGIAASSGGGGQGSEENATPAPAPTISRKLLEKGYTYNPPKLTNHNTLVQGCAENLLNKTGFDNSKFYGCGVAKLDLWDSGNQFESEKVDYLNFASEIFIRKANEGWKINTRINNSSSDLTYQHLLTHYKKRNGEDLEIEEIFLIKVGNNYGYNGGPRVVAFPGKSGQRGLEVGVANTDKKLNIKLPGPKGQWYQGNNYLVMQPDASSSPTLKKVYKEAKTWSGIWIDNSPDDNSWMFKDIEVFRGDMKYSQVFCKEESKGLCGAGTNMLYKLGNSKESLASPNVWWDAENKLATQGAETSTDTSKARQPILNFIKGSRGKWINANDFCNPGDESEINEEKLSRLTIYCSKK